MKYIYHTACLIYLLCSISSINLIAQNNCNTINSLIEGFMQEGRPIAQLNIELKIKYLNFINKQQQWKTNTKVDVTLPYSNSIQSVIQPDGNAVYTPRNFMSPIINITSSKKIISTGGEIGLSGGLDFFKNFNSSSKQFNANWFNVFINQPIFSFNSYKSEKAKQLLDLQSDSIGFYQKQQAKLKEYISTILDYEIIRREIATTELSIQTNINVFTKLKILIENGRALPIDTLLLEASLQQLLLLRANMQKQLELKELQLSNYFHTNPNINICELEELEIYLLDKEQLKQHYMICNFQQELILDSFIMKQNLLKASKSHDITTGISAGVGANQSAQLFPQLFTTPSQRQHVSINASIPLTGWANYERNKEIAKLEYQHFENNKISIYNNADIWIKETLNNYNFLLKSHTLGENKIASLQLLAANQLEKVFAGKANTTEFNAISTQIQSSQLEQFQLLKKLILFRFDIREATLFDVSLRSMVNN